jgi:hypothetical protein
MEVSTAMKKRFADIERARRTGRALVKQFDIGSATRLPVEAFADRLGVGLVEARLDGALAELVVGLWSTNIVLSDRLTDAEIRRWLIAHELGHYVMGHRSAPVTELCAPRPCGPHGDASEDAANGFASAILMPSHTVAAFCDRFPMTFDVPMQLADTCGVPWIPSALRIIESSWRACALAFSQHGRIRWASPSLPFAMLCGRRFCAGRPVGRGALARRFFDGGTCPEDPALVPASAWIDCACPEVQLLEHSVANQTHGAVMTMLWLPTDVSAERPAIATLPYVTAARDHLLDQLTDEAAAEQRSKA